MNDPDKKTVVLIFLGIIAALLILAQTEVMAPVMQFILETDRGTPLQLTGCIIAAGLAMRFVFILLNMLGKYYAGHLDRIAEEKSTRGGEHFL